MQAQQEVEAATQQTSERADTVGEALAPVLNWEKSDVQFWVQILQLVVLLLILSELRRAS